MTDDHVALIEAALDESGLKPCPSCGAPAYVPIRDVNCTKCDYALESYYENGIDPIQAWNTRAITPALLAMLADMKAMVEALRYCLSELDAFGSDDFEDENDAIRLADKYKQLMERV